MALANLGNTCYLNSVIQCLNHSDLPSILESREVRAESFVARLKELFSAMRKESADTCVIRPTSILQSVISDDTNDFKMFVPGDAHELLVYIMTRVFKDISRKVKITVRGTVTDECMNMQKEAMMSFKRHFEKEYTDVLPSYYGQIVNCIQSVQSSFNKSVFDPFLTLHLPIPDVQNLNLYDCLDSYFMDERFTGDNQFFDDKAGIYVDAVKQHKVWATPQNLFIALNRFPSAFDSKKNATLVRIPEILNMGKYMHKFAKKEGSRYQMYAVCKHFGNARGGHYVAVCKSKSGWQIFDDDDVRSFPGSSVIDGDVYILFYSKMGG